MLTVLIDYESGNLHSAHKAFERMAREADAGEVLVSDKAEDVARADRIVLPGDGAFPLAELIDVLRPDLPLSVELRSKALRETYGDPVERARVVLAATMKSLGAL